MEIIDTHTHLYLNHFKNDIDEVISKSIENNIQKFIMPSIDSSHMQSMYDLKSRYPKNIFLMTGLHPVYVKENYKYELEKVFNSLNDNDFVAIGEIGIDLYWDKTYLKQLQKHALRLSIFLRASRSHVKKGSITPCIPPAQR